MKPAGRRSRRWRVISAPALCCSRTGAGGRPGPLARFRGSAPSMLANDSGGQSCDEAHSLFWWQLQQALPASKPVRTGTVAVTVECRGQRDVSYDVAQQDADALIDYLTHRGVLRGAPKPLPALLMPA